MKNALCHIFLFLSCYSHAQVSPDPVPICLVTVDSFSVYNNIFWEKNGLANVDSFRIYRETSADNYMWIGSVSFDSLSMYVDTNITGPGFNGNPNTASHKYKISVVDTGGNESVLSPFHRTIFLQHTEGNLNWSEYLIEGGDPNIDSCNVFRDTTDGDLPPVHVATTAFTTMTWEDTEFPQLTQANYFVQLDWSGSCNPTRAVINKTRSNIKRTSGPIDTIHNPVDTLAISRLKEAGFKIYPQPAKDHLTIEFENPVQDLTIYISDITGKIVYSFNSKSNLRKQVIPLTGRNAGVYLLVLNCYGKMKYEKIMIGEGK